MRGKFGGVLELARYKIGDVVWWLILRHNEPVQELSTEDEWMTNHHPKILFERGPYRSLWKLKNALPRVHYCDFTLLTTLITSKLIIEQFQICDISRSRDTGEFSYSNQDGEWMPESCLFDTNVAARNERSRLLRMIKKWINTT